MSATDAGARERARRTVEALNRFLGISQEEVARRVGVSFTTVNRWARGKATPRPDSSSALQRVLRRATTPAQEDLAAATAARLHVEYGSPRLHNKSDPLDELFFILLSLKTSHLTYEDTYRRFKARFRPWSKLLEATTDEVEGFIRSGGLGSIRARAFVAIARQLNRDFGRVTLAPLRRRDDAEVESYLLSLPGVGLKTARCVAMYALGRNVLPVDTHTYRVGLRLGLVETSKSPNAAHAEFDRTVRPHLVYALHTNYVAHGRKVCKDPTPECPNCTLRDLCAHYAMTRQHMVAAAPPDRGIAVDATPTAVDIYAGCGGLTGGLKSAGFRVKYALDNDPDACETHRANFPDAAIDQRDVRHLSGAQIFARVDGSVDLLAGGPNCQGVSQGGLRSPDDPRNFMFHEFSRLVGEVQPRAFLMENVPGLAHRHNYPLLKRLFESFEDLGYRCGGDVLLAADYGVPQLRYRFFLVGLLEGEPTFPNATHSVNPAEGLEPYVTVEEAIGDLFAVAPSAGDAPVSPNGYRPDRPAFLDYVRQGRRRVYNHVSAETSDLNVRRAAEVPEGGNWKDIPSHLLPPRLFRCRMTDHSTTYARLRRDQPSFTITSLFGNITAGAFTHPTQDRALSVREGARLQGFKDSFRFVGARSSQYRQVGNAVPPRLAEAVAAHVRRLLAGEEPEGRRPRVTPELLTDPRGWDAFPVLTPRFMPLFGQGTKWPKGWGPEPEHRNSALKGYYLRPQQRSALMRDAAGDGQQQDDRSDPEDRVRAAEF